VALAVVASVVAGAVIPTRAQVASLDVQTNFGARGDGVTDDTLAFKNALAQLGASPSGGTLTVPPGTYLVQPSTPQTPGITVPSNVTVAGTQATLKASQVVGGFSVLDVQASNISVTGLTIEGANVAVRGMTIRGGSTNVSLSNDVLQDFTQPVSDTDPLAHEAPAGIRIEGQWRHDHHRHEHGQQRRRHPRQRSGLAPSSGAWNLDRPGYGSDDHQQEQHHQEQHNQAGCAKDDGDCIVIQDSNNQANLTIDNNTFDSCAKRAIKIQVSGATVTAPAAGRKGPANTEGQAHPGL
jgi:pectate lyase